MIHLRRALLASGIALAAAGASAETYRFSMWVNENNPTAKANALFVEELKNATNGEITFELFTGGVLLPPRTTLQGLGDGVAEAGQVTGPYTPIEIPLSNTVQGFGFIESDPIAIGAAFADWMMHDPAAIKEFAGNNVVPVVGFSTANYQLICNTSEPITEAEQIKGLKVRSTGLLASLITSMGGVPVNIPSTEAYQALQTGQLDCAALGTDVLTLSDKLAEVTKFTTMTNLAPIYNSPQITFNKEFWKGLTTEQRKIILDLSARAHARATLFFVGMAEDSLAAAKAKGHVAVEPGESIAKAVQDWVDAGIGDVAGLAKNTFKVEDPEAVFASFEPYVTKWSGLVGGMKDPRNEDELTQLILDHMLRDVDPATYGMN